MKTYSYIADVKYVGLPIGTVIILASNSIPEGDSWLLCNGNTVSKTEYPDLYNVIGDIWNTGNETADTFRLPNTNNRYLTFQYDTNIKNKKYASAGLPSYVHTHSGSSNNVNCTHSHGASSANYTWSHCHNKGNMNIWGQVSGYRAGCAGAFTLNSTKGGDGKSGRAGVYDFNANRNWSGNTNTVSNTHNHAITVNNANATHSHTITVSANTEVNSSIYGKSSTVTPETIYMRAWIKAKNIK